MDTLWANLTSGSMVFLIRQTLIYAVPLMIVALAGMLCRAQRRHQPGPGRTS